MEALIALLEAAPYIEAVLSNLVLTGKDAEARDDIVAMFQRAAAGTGEITAEERAALKADTAAKMARLRVIVESRTGAVPVPE